MNGGNAFAGLLVLAGFASVYPVAAAIIGGLILLEILIRRVPPFMLRRSQRFQYLPPLEQALRRGSQGFALMIFAILGVVAPYVWIYGWRNFGGGIAPLFSRPADAWPLLLGGSLFILGAMRFGTGARLSAGARDAMRRFKAAIWCGVGLLALVYLARSDLSGRADTSPATLAACVAAFALALWLALVGFMRVLLLSWPRGWALRRVKIYIRDNEFSWDDEESARRWWQFWKKRPA